MKNITLLNIVFILFISITNSYGKNLVEENNDLLSISSPNSNLELHIQKEENSDNLYGLLIFNDNNYETRFINIGLKLSNNYSIASKSDYINHVNTSYSGKILSNISEKKEIEDNYNQTIINFENNSKNLEYKIIIRVYNEGIAIKYEINSNTIIAIKQDYTGIDMSKYQHVCYTETGTESGYTKRTQSASTTSLAPLFITSDKISILMNEAENLAIAAPAKIVVKNGVYTFSQEYSNSNSISTSWRYFVFGKTPIEMIYGKYILHSLNQQSENDDSWIEVGKTFRNLNYSRKFETDSIKEAIDFAEKMNIKYILLDAGWYGLGYGQNRESSVNSDPFKPVNTLNITEVVDYGKTKNVGIILYVNKVAWNNYDNEKMLDTYKSWGVKGLKLGFMDGQSKDGLKKVYNIIKGAYERKMIVNVHDNIRQTGIERLYPNLVTMEGIKGNEHRENTGTHTTLLPFSRFMSGSGDYTICYQGYPIIPDVKDIKTTKGHQLALSTTFFCPIQHILWYGKPKEYTNETEVEYFKSLPTVWDDYKVIEGMPQEYFSIARKKDNKWFLATYTANNRETTIKLDFLESGKLYDAITYEDDNQNTIKKNIIEVTKNSEINFSLKLNGGAVAIIQEKEQQDNNNQEQQDNNNQEQQDNNNQEQQDNNNKQAEEKIKQEEPSIINNEEITIIINNYEPPEINNIEEHLEIIEEPEENISKNIETNIENIENETFKIYPNPANNYIKIITTNKNEEFYITDLLGRIMIKTKISEDGIIDISKLKKGFYIISNSKFKTKFYCNPQ